MFGLGWLGRAFKTANSEKPLFDTPVYKGGRALEQTYFSYSEIVERTCERTAYAYYEIMRRAGLVDILQHNQQVYNISLARALQDLLPPADHTDPDWEKIPEDKRTLTPEGIMYALGMEPFANKALEYFILTTKIENDLQKFLPGAYRFAKPGNEPEKDREHYGIGIP